MSLNETWSYVKATVVNIKKFTVNQVLSASLEEAKRPETWIPPAGVFSDKEMELSSRTAEDTMSSILLVSKNVVLCLENLQPTNFSRSYRFLKK
uniref:Uncharacterized protein n=1 Tax=Megaselia scalaris TaxID=36166 RepID=T1GW52_MEGSC